MLEPGNIILSFEFDNPRGCAASVLSSLLAFTKNHSNGNNDTICVDLRTLKELIADQRVCDFNFIKALKWDLHHRYPEYMGPLDFKLTPEFLDNYGGGYTILEHHSKLSDTELSAGYHRLACTEPLILEPEGWLETQWSTLCKICGMNPNNTSRIVLNIRSMEVYISQ